MLQNRAIIAFIALFVLLVAGMFLYTSFKSSQVDSEPSIATDDLEPQSEHTYGITQIDGVHYDIDGTHTVHGEVLMPTPCDLLQVDTLVRESFPEQIILEFSVINESETCAQVITPQRYMVEVQASSEATFQATFNGSPITLNLIPAPEGTTPDEFELFIKG